MSKVTLTKKEKLVKPVKLTQEAGGRPLAEKLLLAVPLLFYSYIYFGLRWLDSQLIPLLKNPLGLLLLLSMSASFVWRARIVKAWGLRLVLAGAGLLFLGLTVSLLSRQAQVLTLKEKTATVLDNQAVQLEAVKTVNQPNFFFSRDQLAAVKVGNERFQFGVFPLRKGLTFWHTTQFGFAPELTISNKQGYVEFADSLYFGLNPIDPKLNKLIPRRPPPRLMLGVGTYPPELEGVFTLPGSNQVYFLRLEQAQFQGKNYNLMSPNYYLWLTNGRLKKPVYRLMVWENNKLIFSRLVKPNQQVQVKDKTINIGKLAYWVEISKVKDYGLLLILAAFVAVFSGLFWACLAFCWRLWQRFSQAA
jgi:hypothetical protein